MSLQDPISDMLTRIRNGLSAKHESVTMPSSKLKKSIATVLQTQGYIAQFEEKQIRTNVFELTINLIYHKNKPVINEIHRMSKPGLRLYTKAGELKPFYNGLGTIVVSTRLGLLTDKECKAQNVGGEVLFKVF